ncbi:DUF6489 family protein [Sphingopyxis sp. MWB1]|uniref:DUF6489 family protein n=1 Tax=Sphingopyxis sp. MWB1 TaxID=1537715 RepID=UPI00051A6ACE|nr:DUF6489 family protein [Sphingopyxis sp. MWB1]
MKFHIEIDCTPEEARRLFGLPDMEPLHDAYLDRARELIQGGVTPDMVEKMMKNWMPMGEAGFDMLQSLFGGFKGDGRSAFGGPSRADEDAPDGKSDKGRRS